MFAWITHSGQLYRLDNNRCGDPAYGGIYGVYKECGRPHMILIQLHYLVD